MHLSVDQQTTYDYLTLMVAKGFDGYSLERLRDRSDCPLPKNRFMAAVSGLVKLGAVSWDAEAAAPKPMAISKAAPRSVETPPASTYQAELRKFAAENDMTEAQAIAKFVSTARGAELLLQHRREVTATPTQKAAAAAATRLEKARAAHDEHLAKFATASGITIDKAKQQLYGRRDPTFMPLVREYQNALAESQSGEYVDAHGPDGPISKAAQTQSYNDAAPAMRPASADQVGYSTGSADTSTPRVIDAGFAQTRSDNPNTTPNGTSAAITWAATNFEALRNAFRDDVTYGNEQGGVMGAGGPGRAGEIGTSNAAWTSTPQVTKGTLAADLDRLAKLYARYNGVNKTTAYHRLLTSPEGQQFKAALNAIPDVNPHAGVRASIEQAFELAVAPGGEYKSGRGNREPQGPGLIRVQAKREIEKAAADAELAKQAPAPDPAVARKAWTAELATFAKALGKTEVQATSEFLKTERGAELYHHAFPVK